MKLILIIATVVAAVAGKLPDCDQRKTDPGPPTSVHKLLPGDIDLVAAIGDSLTAGTGAEAKDFLGLYSDYLGVSWSMGCDDDRVTMPNLIKGHNGGQKGCSTGKRFCDPLFGTCSGGSQGFNYAVPGATSEDMFKQAEALVSAMKDVKGVANQWKVITVAVGGNDVCDDPSVEKYIEGVKAALDHLLNNVGRAFVNLVAVPDMSIFPAFITNKFCEALAKKFPCKFVEVNIDSPNKVQDRIAAMNEGLRNLAKEYEQGPYSEEFAVVLQPFASNAKVPKKKGTEEVDTQFTAIDCFHPSALGHVSAAKALWKNMFEDVGGKTDDSVFEKGAAYCPEEGDYLKTAQNSG